MQSRVSVKLNAVMSKITIVIGVFLCVSFLFGFIMTLADESMPNDMKATGIITSLLLFSLGVVLILQGRKVTKLIRRFKRYVALISEEHITSLDRLAGSTSQSVDFVKKDLQQMIKRKFFVNAVIDYRNNEIVIGEASAQTYAAEAENVRCPGCGAVNAKPRGAAIQCEYCGTPIK
jgi:ribosomal protein S27E